MLKNIFLKTLFEKRRSMLFWWIAVFAMSMLMMSFYTTFSEGAFDSVLDSLPESLRSIAGDISSLKTVPGFVAQQIFAFRVPVLMLIMGTILFAGLTAGDEEKGLLQTLIILPISRRNVLAQKFLAGLAICMVVSTGAFAGVAAGTAFIGHSIPYQGLVEATFMVWLLTAAMGSIAFTIGVSTGNRGVAGSITGLLIFGSYLLTSFAGSVEWIMPFEKLSLFYFYNEPPVAEFGIRAGNLGVLLAIPVVLFIISVVVFGRRDIQDK